MKITVRFFGPAVAQVGFDSAPLEVSGTDSLLQQVAKTFPQLKRPFRLAVNNEFIDEKYSVSAGAIVDVIPPVSGG
jgi:molybdopterin converting factor small subunit